MEYQLRLLDDQNIARAETYTALDDDDALEIACGVYRAISDWFNGYEVWQADRRINEDVHQPPRGMTLEEVMKWRVDNVLDLEERLSTSREAIKSSRKLLEAMNNLQIWRSRR